MKTEHSDSHQDNTRKPTLVALNIRQLCKKIARGRSTIYKWIKEGKFPAGFRPYGTGTRLWYEDEIDEWLLEQSTPQRPLGES